MSRRIPFAQKADEAVAREYLNFLFKNLPGGRRAKAAGYTYDNLPPELREDLLAEARAQKAASKEWDEDLRRLIERTRVELAVSREVA